MSEFQLTKSEKRILGLLFRRGALTQSDIVDFMELRQQSVSRLIASLLDNKLIEESEKIATGRRGYPSTSFVLTASSYCSIGVSVMSDAVALTVMDFRGSTIFEKLTPFNSMPLETVVHWLQEVISELSETVFPSYGAVAGIGVGIAGSFIGEDIGYNTPHYLEEWAGIDLDKILADRLNFPVWTDNDGNVAALSECMTGVGKWANNFAYINISSGVGGGLVLNGELWRGRYGNAGEFAGGLPSNIYPFPNLELLRQLAAKEGDRFDTVHEMLASFHPNWPACNDWIARVRDSLSIIASNATAILDLDAVVLGGRIPKELALKIVPHIELYDQRRRSVDRPTARIVPAESKGIASAVGAAILPYQHSLFS